MRNRRNVFASVGQGLMNEQGRLRLGVASFAILTLLGGCGPQPEAPPAASVPVATAATPDLDAELARAAELKRPAFVLIAESGKSGDDDSARGLLDASSLGAQADQVVPILLDLKASRNRATAARFRALETPVLFSISPRGVIISRDEKPIAKNLVLKRITEAGPKGQELDARLAVLEEPVKKDANDVKSRLALADFFQGQKNMREAIPHLAAVAHSEAVETPLRIRAWVDLALAHLWVTEPEKGRHEARALIAAWGEKIPEAKAGGNLALGTQDAKANRVSRAREEFEASIGAAPDSDYAKRSREGLARLPKEGK
ncbi:hypothetical protein [Singulisphaera sp. PoT]|uniref:hypothetical protein n=1 Tax=Singulisphaera sp. PoT TaxID=3411797 RepID=UPI003BF572CC